MTNNVDYYVDNITISQIDADPLNLAGDKNFGTPTAGPITMDPMMFGITANRWDQTA